MKSIELQFIFFYILLSTILAEKRIVCYYANWSVYRYTTIPILYPETMDPSLCTHIHLAFALINPITLQIEPSENHDIYYTNGFETPLYSRLYRLKQIQSSIKILIAVGGWTAGSKGFNSILIDSLTRAKFIQQTKEFLIKWNFDGIDLDWEFPGDIERGATNDSREKFNILIKEMSQSFQNDTHPFLLTAAVTANPTKIDQGYVLPDFCHYLDYVSIMTYDYHGAWDNVTGMNAPLYGRSFAVENKNKNEWNVNGSIHYWLKKGCPANKMNLGLAIYGRSFTLTNNSKSINVGTETIGGGLAGPYTKENGTLAYFEICHKLRTFNWTKVFDPYAQVPYTYSSSSNSSNRQWVSYDDLESLTAKVVYAQSLNLGGMMLWSLDQDDYTGLFCRQGQFPFTRHVQKMFQSSNSSHQEEFFSSTKVTERFTKQTTGLSSTKPYTKQRPILTITYFSSDSNIIHKRQKTICSFYLLFIICLIVLIRFH